ncbi:hypothetical protein QA649_34440 [Bradyrhizobium sp. CB1717]|uniref:hypothetical protein n=1 Tax=Bradyrhizobium sp. CB1717 TaxID=3039154 RepID=UPI0024B1843B|nr:hypothetical protein [Bradyrhizobium sp. CB1717]WFU23142.1 hypothetical protein QA649_34440 [Bradyrhizobium sp. CB1717]
MSWCDKLASVPTVGLTFDFHFASTDELLSSMTPILDKLVLNNKPTFEIEKLEVFAVTINTHEGFKYAVEPSKASVAFNHRMRPKAVSGGAPTMEMLSKPLPFTELLPAVSDRLIEMAVALPGPKGRSFTRYGVVTTTPVDEDELPPGIKKLIAHFGKPWGGLSDSFGIRTCASLTKTSSYYDRCIHTLARSEDPNELMTIGFDYQRTFTNGQPISQAALKDAAEGTERAALKYFEELAEGNRFDGEIDDAART